MRKQKLKMSTVVEILEFYCRRVYTGVLTAPIKRDEVYAWDVLSSPTTTMYELVL